MFAGLALTALAALALVPRLTCLRRSLVGRSSLSWRGMSGNPSAPRRTCAFRRGRRARRRPGPRKPLPPYRDRLPRFVVDRGVAVSHQLLSARPVPVHLSFPRWPRLRFGAERELCHFAERAQHGLYGPEGHAFLAGTDGQHRGIVVVQANPGRLVARVVAAYAASQLHAAVIDGTAKESRSRGVYGLIRNMVALSDGSVTLREL